MAVSAYVVNLLMQISVYHLLTTINATNSAERESSGNSNVFTVYPNPWGSSVKR